MRKLAFLVMPLWQGSASSRAMQLADGAAALREDLPRSARFDIAVPLEAGDALGTPVSRLSSVLQASRAAREHIAQLGPSHIPVTVGGDCSSALPGLAAAIDRHGAHALSVLWFDAHADLQHPSTSPTGAAASMTLRHALGDGCEDLLLNPALPDSALTLIGTRSLEADEDAEILRRGIRRIDHTGLSPEGLSERVREAGAVSPQSAVYLHIDLDVLDPSDFTAVSHPAPFGLTIGQLTESMKAGIGTSTLAGVSISGFQPHSTESANDHLPTVLRILGALTGGRQA